MAEKAKRYQMRTAGLALAALLLSLALNGCAVAALVGTAATVTGVAAKTTVKAGAAAVRTTGRVTGAAVRAATGSGSSSQ
jgi:hypothetical protein